MRYMLYAFAAVLIVLFSTPPFAGHAAGLDTSCAYSGATSKLSCISPSNTSQFLSDSRGYSLRYEIAQRQCGTVGTNCLNLYQNPSAQPPKWTAFSYTVKSVLCSGTMESGAPGDLYFTYEQPFPANAPTRPFASLWFRVADTVGLHTYQVLPLCGGTGPSPAFINANHPKPYFSLAEACATALAGDRLAVRAMPKGIPFWLDSCDMTAANLTLTLEPGAKVYGGTCEGGAGQFCIHATGITLDGAGAELGYANGAFVNSNIDIIANSGKNATIQGKPGEYFVVDCQQMHGQTMHGTGMHAIESGNGVELVTIKHFLGKNCGGGPTGAHTIYLSLGPNASPTHLDYCESVDDLVIQDAVGDTTADHFDDTCGDRQGTIVNMKVYCTIEGFADGNCDQNEPIDYQCGGWHSATRSVFEMYGQPGENDQVFFAKAYDLYYSIAGSSYQCPMVAPAKNAIRFDRDIFIFDGHAYYPNGYDAQLTVACGSASDGNDCRANAGPDVSTVSSTRLTVSTGSIRLMIGTGFEGRAVGNGTPITISAAANPANNMTGYITSYNPRTGVLAVTVGVTNGAGTFSSWTVATPAHVAVCVTNSQIVEDDDDFDGPAHHLVIGPGVYTDSGCTKATGTDTNTYYRGRTGTVDAGRRLACSAANWSRGAPTRCIFPFVPRSLAENETHEVLVAQAHAAGYCGAGTSDDPIRTCGAERDVLATTGTALPL